MVFFGDIASDLVGKPVDVLIAENCALLFAVPAEIFGLIGKNYVADVAVSWYSFRNNDISFQVLKVYPEGSSVFAGFDEALLATSKFWILLLSYTTSDSQHACVSRPSFNYFCSLQKGPRNILADRKSVV